MICGNCFCSTARALDLAAQGWVMGTVRETQLEFQGRVSSSSRSRIAMSEEPASGRSGCLPATG